jgi:hypothetical protein
LLRALHRSWRATLAGEQAERLHEP